jgi:transcriptional regulator GlxA family with amidase domain
VNAYRGGPRRVGILVHDNVTMIDAAGPADVFHHAVMFGARYETLLVSADGRPVRASNGLTIHADTAASQVGRLDTVIVPGAYGMVDRPFDPAMLQAVRELAERSRRVTSGCTGSFLLAHLGYLDGRRATTHWTRTDLFARSFPRVRVQRDALFVRDGDLITSAGVSSGIDLGLAIVEDDHGPAVARDVARQMVVFLQRPGEQQQLSAASRTPVPRDNPLRRVIDAIAADPASDYSVGRMAQLAAVSPRTLNRLFRSVLNTTPTRYVELVRLEAAQAHLRHGATTTRAAALSGFGSAETFRRAAHRWTGTSPTAGRSYHPST